MANNRGYFMKDVLETAVIDKMVNASPAEFAELISTIFNCQCEPSLSLNHPLEFNVLFVDNCDELQPYIDRD